MLHKIIRFLNALMPLFAGLLTVLIIITLMSNTPQHVIWIFFTGTFSSRYYFGLWLNTAALLLTAALGTSLALKSGSLNLGGEGQIYAGGFIAVLLMNYFMPAGAKNLDNVKLLGGATPLNISLVFIISLFCAIAVSALIALASAVLKNRKNIAVLLTSFMLSAALIPLIDYAVSGPLRDKEKNLLALPAIHKKLILVQLLKPSPLNPSFFAAIGLALIGAFFLYKTRVGQQFRIAGKAPEFALYCGYPIKKITAAGLAFSGALHGLAGFFAVAGTYYTCYSGFYAGMGWNALSAALIARSNPFLLIPVSFLLSFIFTGASKAALTAGMSFDLANLIQGAIFLCISASFVLEKKRC